MLKSKIRKLVNKYGYNIIRSSPEEDLNVDTSLTRYKDKHAGERCVIIGNGPSLIMGDLEKLNDVITFASNKIYLAFDETDWRPTYYTVEDFCVAENNSDKINELEIHRILPHNLREILTPTDKTTYITYLGDPTSKEPHYTPMFSKDLVGQGIYGGYSVVYMQMQLAYYMGFEKVYLIGMDHSFKIPERYSKHHVYGEVLISNGDINHFHPDYRNQGETWSMPQLDKMETSFYKARQIFDEAGRRIYNATRGGHLEIFDRISFEDLFS
ncbi:6-hydroxymethylpterin diphosphokinase MptE-like protein [Chloroflexota bacterium]